MKRISTMMIWLGCCLASGSPALGQTRVEGSGYILTQQRETAPFSSIEISRELKAFVVEGALEPLTVEADDNLFPYIRTEVSQGKLRIFIPDSILITKYAVMNILISMPGIRELRASTAAHINGPSQSWKLKEVFLETDETATIRLHTDAQSLTVKASSYSYMELKGSAAELRADLATNGSLYARDLKVRDATIGLETGAEAKIEVYGKISYYVGDGCRLTIRGDASIIKQDVKNGGDVTYEK